MRNGANTDEVEPVPGPRDDEEEARLGPRRDKAHTMSSIKTTNNPQPKPKRTSILKKYNPRIGLKSNTIFNYFRKQDPGQMENKLELNRAGLGKSKNVYPWGRGDEEDAGLVSMKDDDVKPELG